MITKIVCGNIYRLNDGVWLLHKELPNREKGYITLTQLEEQHPEFINKLSDIIFDAMTERDKNFARSVLEFLRINQYVSWKQFDSILKVKV